MRFLSRLATAAALSLVCAAPVLAQQGSLTIAYHTGPANAAPDPRARQFGWLSNQVGVTETLMGLDRDLKLFPRLAETIEQTGPQTWRVTLRDGVLFHDGSPMTAQSVIDSLAPIAEEGHSAHNPRLVALLDLAGIEAVDANTLVFRTNAPNAAFPWTLTESGVTVLGPASDPVFLGAGDHNASNFYQHQRFNAVVPGEGCAEVSLRDGERALAMGMAAQISAQEGRAVAMQGLWRVWEGAVCPPACGPPEDISGKKKPWSGQADRVSVAGRRCAAIRSALGRSLPSARVRAVVSSKPKSRQRCTSRSCSTSRGTSSQTDMAQSCARGAQSG